MPPRTQPGRAPASRPPPTMLGRTALRIAGRRWGDLAPGSRQFFAVLDQCHASSKDSVSLHGMRPVAQVAYTGTITWMESHISAARVMEAFPEVVERVRVGGEVFVVERDGEAICRIEPIVHPRTTLQGLVGLLRTASRPDDEYLDAVEEISRKQPVATETKWE